jgi:hypothetical protein
MKPVDPNSRSQRILRFVAASAKPVSHDDIMAVVRTDPSDATAKNLGNKVSATLAILCDADKLKRTGAKFCYRYERTPKTLQVPRAPKATPKTKQKPATRAQHVKKPAALQPAKKAKAQPLARVSELPTKAAVLARAAPAKRVGEFRIVDKPPRVVVPNANLTRPRASALDSAQIEADIAAFEARGGRVERFKQGESSQSIREQHEAYLAARSARSAAKQRTTARTAAARSRASNDEALDADLVDVA